MHTHAREDEWYEVLEGRVTFHVGDEDLRAGPGSFAFLPRGVPHTFTVESERAQLLLLIAPGGFERMFALAPATAEDALAALRRYDVDVVGAHPRDRPRP